MTFLLLYWKYIAAAALIGALALFYNLHVDGLIKVAVDKAVIERDTQWRASEQKAVDAAKAQAAAQEAAHALALKAVQDQRKKDADNAKLTHDRDVAAARSGALKLRIPTDCTSPADVPSPSGSPSPGPATTALPAGLTERLLGLADDADALTGELNACWEIVANDRLSTLKGSP